MASQDSNRIQLLTAMRDLTHGQFRLGMFDRIEEVTVDAGEGKAGAVIQVHRYKETSREYRITEKGTRYMMFTKGAAGWTVAFDTTSWDEDHRTEYVSKYNNGRSLEDKLDQYEWEVLCHRPGTARTPLDNAESVDSDRMAKHWRLPIRQAN